MRLVKDIKCQMRGSLISSLLALRGTVERSPRPRWLAEFSTTNETAAVICMASGRRSSVVLILACCLDRIFSPSADLPGVTGVSARKLPKHERKYEIFRALINECTLDGFSQSEGRQVRKNITWMVIYLFFFNVVILFFKEILIIHCVNREIFKE